MPATPATDEASRLSVLRARLASPMPDDRPWGWLGPLLVTAFGTFLRFDRLRVPRALIFDETYYAKDAWSILQHGVEWNYVSNANTLMLQGHTANLFVPCSGTGCGEYVVQPELGKLIIAVGEAMFGLDSYGWRCCAPGWSRRCLPTGRGGGWVRCWSPRSGPSCASAG